MKHKLTNILLIAIFILISNSSAVTLTQKLGDEYISQEIEPGETVTLSFTNQPSYTFDSWVVESGNVSIDTSNSVVEFTMPNEDVIIEANYTVTPTEYTVTFDANGGTSSLTSKKVTYGNEYGELASATKPGYAFAGWYLDKTYIANASIVSQAKNHTLVAKWTERTYEVTLDHQNGTSNTTVSATYISPMPSVTIPTKKYAVAFELNGGSGAPTSLECSYAFNGYYTSTDGNGIKYYTSTGDSARNWDKTSTTTLYAYWTLGSITLPIPTKAGYTFGGWYKEAELTNLVGIGGVNYTPEVSTLYARWIANRSPYTVQHYIQDANDPTQYTLHRTETKYDYTDTSKHPANEILSEGDFVHCAYSHAKANGVEVTTTIPKILGDGSLLLEIYYTRNEYKLTLQLEEGTFSSTNIYRWGQTISVEADLTSYQEDASKVWNQWISSNTSIMSNQGRESFMVEMGKGDVVLTASWNTVVTGGGGGGTIAPTEYIIAFDGNGGEGSMANQKVLIGMSLTLNQNEFTKTGYIFKGWSTVKDGPVVYKDQASITPESNMSLFAVWRPYAPGTLPKDWFILGSKTGIVTIEFVDEYVPTGEETNTWPADAEGKINCYVVGTKLIISGNGSGEILASADQSGLFSGFTALTSVKGLEIFNTSNTTDMSAMFSNCSSLYLLDLSTFDVSNVTNMSNMFNGCSALNRLTTSMFDTSKVTNMSYMFANCNVANIDLSILNTSAVTNMSYMFYKSSCPDTINVSSFNTSKVTNMSYMFASSNVKTLDLSNFNTATVTTKTSMFDTCNYLRKVTLGANCNVGTLLPTPSSTYITGATGYWYSPNGVTCKSSSIPNNTAETYYANVENIAYKFKLSYDVNGGYEAQKPPVQVYAGNATSFTFKVTTIKAWESSFDYNYGYDNTTTWHKNGTIYTAGSNITISSNTTLYAYWNTECYCNSCSTTIAAISGFCSSCEECSNDGWHCSIHDCDGVIRTCSDCGDDYCSYSGCDCCDCCGYYGDDCMCNSDGEDGYCDGNH